MSMRDELSGREEPVPKVSQSMSGHLLESWMKIVNGEDVDKPNELDRAFAHTMESLNETLPSVIQELYLATGTMSRQDAQPSFYQGPLGFISAAVFGVVFYEMVRSLPSVIRRASNWMHDTQDELASAVDRFLHNHPRVLNTTDGSEMLMYKDMAWNRTYFKNIAVSPDYVKKLFKI
ncbi:uncharacterized protein LOC128385506 [Panonychus citri]|uniref:uncharacterized protein LOC128385506 n=1 Tax=Panonychus citri TaxID=50023 RepID=UPI002307ED9E|nr:uncharacterized protein LOC128385506 [Panonychus citri]